jgi:hypothetical protein
VRLRQVHVEVVPDLAQQLAGYRSGQFDAVGFGEVLAEPSDLGVFWPVQRDEDARAELILRPFLRTDFFASISCTVPSVGSLRASPDASH